MPRLTQDDYIKRRRFLIWLWEDSSLRILFSVLDPQEQWDLHQYFQTAPGDHDRRTLITSRKTITSRDPSLPHRAGRSYARLFTAFRHSIQHTIRSALDEINTAVPAPVPLQRNVQHIRVKSVLKREPDYAAIARAVLIVAKEQGLPPTHTHTSSLKPPSDRRLAHPELDSDLAA